MSKLFGLDIGSISIKAVEVTGDKGNIRLAACDFIPVPGRGIKSESVVDQQLFAQTVKKLMSIAKINTKFVNVSLAESEVYTRVIEMPVLSDNELSSAIRWEGEQYIPLPVSSVSLDWQVLERNKETGQMRVLLVGAPINIIGRYQKVLGMAELEIISVETEILAAARSLISFSEKTPASVILDLGATSTDIGIFRDGVLVLAYTIPTGGNALTRAIAGEFSLEFSQAEQYKKTYGIESGVLEGKIAAASKPVLDAILTEVKKAISFYEKEKLDNKPPIARIILTGGGAGVPGIELFFAQSLGIETELGNPWKKIAVDPNIFKKQQAQAYAYSIATGLALRDYG